MAVQKAARVNMHSEYLKPMTLVEANSHDQDLPLLMHGDPGRVRSLLLRVSACIDCRSSSFARSHILNHAQRTAHNEADLYRSNCTVSPTNVQYRIDV